MRNSEIDRRVAELAEGDSNDEEIDGLTEIIRELQEERAEMGVRIVFNAEAFETTMRVLDGLEGYRVELTLAGGEKYDGFLRGMDNDRSDLLFQHFGTFDDDLQSITWEEVDSIYVY